MTDSITKDDVRRVDNNVDPSALTDEEIESAMPDDFSSEAKDAFADRVAGEREQISNSFRDNIDDRLGENPATGETMVRNDKGHFAASADAVVDTELDSDGGFYANLDDGSRVRVKTVNLQQGADGTRAANPDW